VWETRGMGAAILREVTEEGNESLAFSAAVMKVR
jgi:hypothetical protein